MKFSLFLVTITGLLLFNSSAFGQQRIGKQILYEYVSPRENVGGELYLEVERKSKDPKSFKIHRFHITGTNHFESEMEGKVDKVDEDIFYARFNNGECVAFLVVGKNKIDIRTCNCFIDQPKDADLTFDGTYKFKSVLK